MPELPEVEHMTERLQRWVGYSIQSTSATHPRYFPDEEAAEPVGQKINGVYRRGKYIIFALDHGALLCHNAMSGYWDTADDPWTFDYVEGKREARESDVRAKLVVCQPSLPLHTAQVLRFHDARKFGSLRYLEVDQFAAKLSELGPDALQTKHLYEPSSVIDPEKWIDVVLASKKPIKVLLMDQTKLAGVGNIYAAEGCWAARVNPFRPGADLSEAEAEQVLLSTQAVMEAMIDYKINYKQLRVYRRAACPAMSCGSRIVGEELAGRTTWYCPRCQK